MELTRLPEIPYVDARKMAEAGVVTVAALASLHELHGLAHRTGLDEEALEGYRAAARSHVERLLAGAGIAHETDLAAADSHALAAATGLPVDEVEQFQAAARASLAKAAPPHHEHPTVAEEARPVEMVPQSTTPERVVLVEGEPTAQLVVGARTLASVPIVAGRFAEDAPGALARAGEIGVFLSEGATAAIVRVEGATYADVPIYKGDTRVRIKEIRERGAGPKSPPAPEPAKKGLFSKLLKRS
ncbi:MAG: hypothetical protein QOE90_990 [Thermoplasmata archaeon]|jgi:hypothetical protein|nr:hypothetical protein [Thermoplasmata archaeon]